LEKEGHLHLRLQYINAFPLSGRFVIDELERKIKRANFEAIGQEKSTAAVFKYYFETPQGKTLCEVC
jgi:hypothetical protein